MMLNLYMVRNFFTGAGAVRVYVIAESKERAIRLAREQYKKETSEPNSHYDEEYYEELEADLMCEGVNKEWVSRSTSDGVTWDV